MGKSLQPEFYSVIYDTIVFLMNVINEVLFEIILSLPLSIISLMLITMCLLFLAPGILNLIST